MQINTVRDFLDALRQGSFSSHGCYPLFFLTSDGETLCPKCAREHVWLIARAVRDRCRGGWRADGHDVNWEDPEMYCAQCNERIESAYAEDQAEILGCLWACHRQGEYDGTQKSMRECLTRAGINWKAVQEDIRILREAGRLDGWG